MINFTDILVVAGLFVLRIGVPVAIIAGLVYMLKRLDQRWEAEARSQQAAEQPAKQAARQAAVAQTVQTPIRAGVPASQVPVDSTRLGQQSVAPMSNGEHCWDVKNCAEGSRKRCAAYQHPDLVCWQARLQTEGKIPEKCPTCEIFQSYPLN